MSSAAAGVEEINVPQFPYAQCLITSLATLLTFLLTPLQLLEMALINEFVACAVPQWQVLIYYFFDKKAIPALHQHMEGNVSVMLDHAAVLCVRP